METKVVVGIDITKDHLDVAMPVLGKEGAYQHFKFSNKIVGFKQLCKHLVPISHCEMEASGVYYLPLAVYLHGKDMQVSIVNPLTI